MSEEKEVKGPTPEELEKLLDKFTMFRDDFALFIDTSFIAIKQLDEISAKRIVAASMLLNPTHVAPRIALGNIYLRRFEIKQATATFQGVLDQEPDHHLAQCFLGICYLLTKGQLSKGEALLKDAKEKSTDEAIHNLVTVALGWAERDLKNKKDVPLYNPGTEEKMGGLK